MKSKIFIFLALMNVIIITPIICTDTNDEEFRTQIIKYYKDKSSPDPDEALDRLIKAHKITNPKHVEDFKKRVREHIAEQIQTNKHKAAYYFGIGLLGLGIGTTIGKNYKEAAITNPISLLALAYGALRYWLSNPSDDVISNILSKNLLVIKIN